MSIPLLEIEVKAEQQLTGIYVGGIQPKGRPCAVLMQPVVFVVPRETGPVGHERVIAVDDGVGRDITEVRSGWAPKSCVSRSIGLLRHPDRLIPSNENQLRTIDVVRLEQNSVPAWISRTCRQGASSRVVVGSDAVDEIAITLTEPGVILAMLSDDLQIEMLAEVKLPNEAFATEVLVPNCSARNYRAAARRSAILGQPCGRSLSHHGVETNSLHASLASVKSLAGSEESRISVSIGQLGGAVIGAEDRGRVTRAVVEGVTHHFNPELVISHLSEDVAIIHRRKVVKLVDAAVAGERKDALLRQKIVELELAELHVEPGTAPEVVEARHDGLKVESTGRVGRG